MKLRFALERPYIDSAPTMKNWSNNQWNAMFLSLAFGLPFFFSGYTPGLSFLFHLAFVVVYFWSVRDFGWDSYIEVWVVLMIVAVLGGTMVSAI